MGKWSCFVAAAVALSLNAEVIRLEAERFGNLGAWTVESQYHQKLGSSYLQANGCGPRDVYKAHLDDLKALPMKPRTGWERGK